MSRSRSSASFASVLRVGGSRRNLTVDVSAEVLGSETVVTRCGDRWPNCSVPSQRRFFELDRCATGFFSSRCGTIVSPFASIATRASIFRARLAGF